MPQIFHRSTNTLSKLSVFGAVFMAGALIGVASFLYQSSYVSQEGVAREQPVPFSHEHHVRGLGIDCRYCHTGVEDSPVAGLPSAKTCMSCHSQVWTNAEILEPIRSAYRSGAPVRWTRVHQLPQYVYFNHSIHVAKGVACASCHGAVDRMPLTYQQNSLHMSWCLECHRHPETRIGPQNAVFSSQDSPASSEPLMSPQERMNENHVKSAKKLTDCYACHR